MTLPLEALKRKDGAAYLGGGALCFVLAVALAVGGVERFMEEEELRAAVAAFHRDANDARSLLLGLKDVRPEDPSIRVLLGCLEVERADGDADRIGVAERLFEEALSLDPSRSSAAIGLAVARLKLAAMKAKDGRVQAAKAVGEALDRAPIDAAHPDVIGLRAAIDLMRGRTAEALKALDAPPADALLSRDGQAAWRWNRALAACLARRGDVLEDACAAYALRRLPMPQESPGGAEEPLADAARLLVMGYRVALADAGATPSTPEAQLARCEAARRALGVRSGASGTEVRGRYLPPRREEAVVMNALGIALGRLERWPEAVDAFEDAAREGPKDDPQYLLNLAEARRRQALATPEDQAKDRAALRTAASETYGRVAKMLEGKAGREATRILAATNGAALLLANDRAMQAFQFYKVASEGHPNAAERARDLGALLDHAKHNGCVEEYRRAISLSHPDSAALERRIRVRSR